MPRAEGPRQQGAGRKGQWGAFGQSHSLTVASSIVAAAQALALNPWGGGCSQLGLSLKSCCGDTGSDPCVSGSLGDLGPGEDLQPMSRCNLRNHSFILNREFLSFFLSRQ